MTKKDYELLAALAAAKPHERCGPSMAAQWEADCKVLASALVATNPRFDRARFLAACGDYLRAHDAGGRYPLLD